MLFGTGPARMPVLVEASRTLLICSLVLAAAWLGLVAAYWGWIRRHRRQGMMPHSPRAAPTERVDVIVAVMNEERDIGAKLEDLRALDYPPEALRFFIVDGGSTDSTVAIVSSTAERDPRFHLVPHGIANKVAQLNAVWPRLTAPFVLVTDADSRMAPGTLTDLVNALRGDAGLGIVGTSVARPLGHDLERHHTALIDAMRAAEARAGTASIVMGPCYLGRRDVIDGWPEDAYCDDVFVSFDVLAKGLRVGYLDADVSELRAPLSFRDLVRHKCRKASAYLHEVFRHLPLAARMKNPGRDIFLWRATQFLVAPPLALAAAAALLGAAWSAGPLVGIAALGIPGALLGAAAARPSSFPRLQPLLLVVVLNAILLGVLAAYPFYRQTATYRKVRTATPLSGAEAA